MKKAEQLGMNPSTASGRLVKDLLFRFVIESGCKCFRCGEELSREDFSIDHVEPWLDSENPKELYFDLGNVAFSHLACNSKFSRTPWQKWYTPEERKAGKLEYEKKFRPPRKYDSKKRRVRYLKTGT